MLNQIKETQEILTLSIQITWQKEIVQQFLRNC